MIHFIAHGEKDTVAVAVVDIEAGKSLEGWNMATDATIKIDAKQDVPLGHKIALKDIKQGESVVKYDEEIGKASQDIQQGQHVHTQNLKTARW